MQNEKFTSNYIIFAVLALGIIFGYSKLFPAATGRAPAETPAVQKSAAATPAEQTAVESVSAENLWAESGNGSEGSVIEIETPLYTARVNTQGGTIESWVLKNYLEDPENGSGPLKLVGGETTAPEAVLSFEGTNIPSKIPFRYKGETAVKVDGLSREIALVYEKGGMKIVKTLSFSPDTYLIGGRYDIRNRSSATVEYAAHFLQNGKVEEERYGPSDALIASVGGEVKRFNGTDDIGKPLSGKVEWLGFSKKYFILASLPESGRNTGVSASAVGDTVKTRFSYGRFSIPPGSEAVRQWKSYLGPKREKLLAAAGYGFENAIDYGWFGTLSRIAVRILNYTNGFFNNYGVSIIVITFAFRLLFLPMSVKGMRSMKKMQKKMETIKPKLDALKEKFKDDKKRQNEEMMKLYSSHGINPLSSLGGCLPMLAQVPVFIALYYGLLYSIDLRHSSFLWISDLSAPEMLFDIPLTSVPFRILPLAMGISWWFSTKLTPIAAAGDTAAMQAKIMQFMPVVFTFVMWDFPSGLVLYWTASNVLSVAQQIYINRSTA